MQIFDTIILALVQGITEFLPISSSGHLVLMPRLFGIDEPSLGLSVALHIGTLLAVVLYFWSDWVVIFARAFRMHILPDTHPEYSSKMLWFLVVATIPAAVAGYFLEDIVVALEQYPLVVAAGVLVGGSILWMADVRGKKNVALEFVGIRQALLIGFSQIAALFAGISRSGITISAGLLLGLNRKDAARFSFLMATPIIIGAGLLELPSLFATGFTQGIFVGILVSFVSAYLVIKYMLRFIEKVQYRVFFWYSLVLVVVTLMFIV
jgi:undecaprenyl-diphosphatase